MSRALIIWRVCDGKPGHENQSLGLAEALQRRTACDIHRISLAGKRGIVGRIRAALAASAGFPKPDLILAAGHATHPALLWLARRHRAKSIVLMKPSLPMSWFDLCIAPSHDFPNGRSRPNLILTRGAINRIVTGTGEKTGKLILIGGPSKTHGWDGGALLSALAEITAAGSWQLTDSRRTPAGFLDQVRQRLPTIEVFPHQETSPDWLPGKLAAAAEVWVTEDSISMIYEALTSGAKVGLLPVPRLKAESRVTRGIGALMEDGFITPFAEWVRSGRMGHPPEPLREADRGATCLIDWLSRPSPSGGN